MEENGGSLTGDVEDSTVAPQYSFYIGFCYTNIYGGRRRGQGVGSRAALWKVL